MRDAAMRSDAARRAISRVGSLVARRRCGAVRRGAEHCAALCSARERDAICFPILLWFGYGKLGLYTSLHATSSVAPAPCSACARPCLDVWWGEPFLAQHPLRWPARPGTHAWEGCRAREITVWY